MGHMLIEGLDTASGNPQPFLLFEGINKGTVIPQMPYAAILAHTSRCFFPPKNTENVDLVQLALNWVTLLRCVKVLVSRVINDNFVGRGINSQTHSITFLDHTFAIDVGWL